MLKTFEKSSEEKKIPNIL